MDSAQRSTKGRKAVRRSRHPDPAVEARRPWPALRSFDFEGDDTSLTQAEIEILK